MKYLCMLCVLDVHQCGSQTEYKILQVQICFVMEPLIVTFCEWQKTEVFKLSENCSEVRNTGIKTKHILIRLCGKVL